MLMIRAMSPQIVAVDEIGGIGDMRAITEALSCGCKVIATVHGESIGDITGKTYMEECVRDRLFKRFIFIRNADGRQFDIYDNIASWGILCGRQSFSISD